MSKIAEQKAHQFLMKEHTSFLNKLLHEADLHVEFQYHKDIENSYANGYDQAMQDFLEKAEEWLKDNSKKYAVCYEDGYSHYASNSMIDDFKNHMENESEN